MGRIIEKIFDVAIDFGIKFLVNTLKFISPVKISPKKVDVCEDSNDWGNIVNVAIKNRVNSDLYNIMIAGISKEEFSVKVISDSGAKKEKTVEHMNINTDRLIVYATDSRNDNKLWIFRVHKLRPKEIIVLRLKIKNKTVIYLKTINHDFKEVPIRERNDGVVSIPFKPKHVPEI